MLYLYPIHSRRTAPESPIEETMSRKRTDRVREQVMVYLDEKDRELLEEMVETTGLARTELFRRGLRRLAADTLDEPAPGSSLDHLVETGVDDDVPPDVSARPDDYLYGGGYRGEDEGPGA
jgi:hypothetical protein